MTTQTLETIPEETVERVTSDVPKTKPATAKNPGRVASGKRLAERNRLAREAKKQAEAQKPPTNTTTEANASDANESVTTDANTAEQSSNSSSTNTGYFIFAIGGLIVSGLSVCYQREAIMKTLGQSQKPAPAESRNRNEKAESVRWNNLKKNYVYTHHEHKHCNSFFLLGLFDLSGS